MSTLVERPATPAYERRVRAGSALDLTEAPRTDVPGTGLQRRFRWRFVPSRRSVQPSDELRRARLERLLALLEAARAEVTKGWVQGGWWAVPTGGGGHALANGLGAGAVRADAVTGVCLVGSLLRSAARQDSSADSEISGAVDAVYDALWESRGQPWLPGEDLLTARAPQVRRAEVQRLTAWNDAAGRTQQEVVGVLDRAITRTVLTLCDSRRSD